MVIGALLALVLPWLDERRTFLVATPVPAPLYREERLALDPGRHACLGPVAVPASARRALLVVRAPAAGGPALRLTASGPGLAESAGVPGGYGAGVVAAGLAGARQPVLATVCLANVGASRVVLAANPEGGRVAARLGGRPVAPPLLSLAQAGRQSIGRRAPEVAGRLTGFRPGFVGAGLVLAVLVAAAGAALLALPLAYARAARRGRAPR